MARFLLFLCAVLVAAPLFAAKWYVATNGSDRNPGTIDKPLATIDFGVSKLSAAGDTLIVRRGTYRENVTIWRKRGNAGDPIAVYAQKGEKPVIDGIGSSANGVVTIVESSFVAFEGFEVRNGGHSGMLIHNSQQVAVRWNTIHDCQTYGIAAVGDRAFDTRDVVIEGNEVTRCVLSNAEGTARQQWAQALSAFRCARVTITRNYVHENFGEGIDYIVSDRGTITRNRLWDNFSVNIYLDNATNTLVDANFVTSGWAGNARQFLRAGSHVGGIMAANERYETQNPLHDLTITNNVVAGTSSAFSYSDSQRGGGLHRVLVANNTFVLTTRAILDIEPSKHDHVTIANNLFEQADDAPPPRVPASGIVFRTNAWHGGRAAVHGQGDVTADPLFVTNHRGVAEDYRLQARSPLRNAATALPQVKTDFTGARRRGRTIGAFDD